MTDEYITNMNTEDILDDNEPLAKLKIAQAELESTKQQLDEKNKLCMNQKHQIDDFVIEVKDLNDKLKNKENLIKFYQEKSEQENDETETDPEKKDKIKQLEIKNMKLEEKIKELEENKIKMENDYDVITQQLDEEKAIGQKALEFIAEKDDEIEELKKKIKDGGDTDNKKEGELTEEEVQALKEEFLNQQEDFDSYKVETAKKIDQYIKENDTLLNNLNNYKEMNSNMELELSQLREANERLENEKRLNEKLLEEKNLKEDHKENEFIIEIQNLQNQLEETQRKNAENLSKIKETNKYEREEYEKIINELKQKNDELDIEKNKFKDDLNKKEQEFKASVEKLKEQEKLKENELIQKENQIKDEKYENVLKEKEELVNNLKKELDTKEKDSKKKNRRKRKQNPGIIKKK